MVTTDTQLRGEFVTERLPLAIFLHAEQRLPFLRCDSVGHGKIRFVFLDADAVGCQVELEFDRGAEVSATKLFASQKYLRRCISEITEKRKTENTENEYDRTTANLR